MNQFPATEAKVAYDHLTFRSTVEVLKAETPLEWDEFWVRVRSDKVMTRVAQAMLRAAALELCEPLSPDHKGEHSALAANNQSDALIGRERSAAGSANAGDR